MLNKMQVLSIVALLVIIGTQHYTIWGLRKDLAKVEEMTGASLDEKGEITFPKRDCLPH